MVYALHKFRNYLLGSNFKMYTYYSALRYLVNNIVLGEVYVDGFYYSRSMNLK
jgi:hypothetical protein